MSPTGHSNVGPRRVLIGRAGRRRPTVVCPYKNPRSEASITVPKLLLLASAPVSSAAPQAAATCRCSLTLSRSQALCHFFPAVAGAVAPEAPPPSSSPVSGPPSSPHHFAAALIGHPHSILPSSTGCHVIVHLHLCQFASTVSAPSPPLPRLEHTLEVTHRPFKAASTSRTHPR
jgi:hypothetical protein